MIKLFKVLSKYPVKAAKAKSGTKSAKEPRVNPLGLASPYSCCPPPLPPAHPCVAFVLSGAGAVLCGLLTFDVEFD